MPDDSTGEVGNTIAALRAELAQAKAERDEALAQQTATAEMLQVINSSPGDLAPVFDAMLEKALRLCDAAFGNLLTYDGELTHTAAFHGALPEHADFFRSASYRPEPGTALSRLVEGEPYLHEADITDTDAYRSGVLARRRLADVAGARTALWVALRKEGVLLGLFTIYRREVRPFTDKQIALLQNFAVQAVIAMENARLITETREALDQQTATAEVLQVINSSPGDLAPVFEAMLDKALHLCEAGFGYLLTYDGEGLIPVADRGNPAFSAWVRERGKIVPEPGTINERIIGGEAVVQVADVANDPFYQSDTAMRRAVLEIGGFRTVLTVALRKDDALLGVIHIYRQEVRPFSDRQIALLENFAAQAVIAIENARLISETQEALEQQTATAEVLQVINSSPGDLAPVFGAILEKAHALCGAGHGALFVRDGEVFKLAALHDAPERLAELLRQHGLGADAPAIRGLLDGAPVVHIPDMTQLDHPVVRAAVANGVRTLLSVPLRKDGLLGAIIAVRFEVQPFTDKEIALLQNFAAQAVIAMENARLLGELRQRTEEVAELNRGLEARVAAQLAELRRVGNLKRFLPPQVAEMVVSQGDERILESHRREIVVVFADVRSYTTFTETAEPEEVIEFLGEYHAVLGPLITRFEGTLSHFFGDGVMVFFNDPVPCPDPAQRAVNMALAMRDSAGELMTAWRRRGHRIGFGVGIAQGYATLGQIGFAERMDYTAIGTVTNLAARLCDAAEDGQILISSRIATAVDDMARLEEIGDRSLKGLSQAVAVYNIVS